MFLFFLLHFLKFFCDFTIMEFALYALASVYDKWAEDVIGMCVCMCACVCHANQSDLLRPHRWTHHFCSWLIWKVNSAGLIGCKNLWDVTWPWPIYLSPNFARPTKITFFSLASVDFLENRSRCRNKYKVLGNWVWAFQRQLSETPYTFTAPPHPIFHFKWFNSAAKLFWSTTSSGNVVCLNV